MRVWPCGGDAMELPIRFPDEGDVIRADAARFRALTPAQQAAELEDLLRTYYYLAARSDRPDMVARLAQEEEDRGRAAILEFAARHG